ncbi:MAG TPA: MerR family transcriptional regulator [Terriglobales bacterium]|nr:MerR family transcriptional regulator [Terriglobales bacterium]
MTAAFLTRGQLARAATVHPETIRFYERHGLLPPAARSPRGHRLFPAAAVEQLHLIRDARWLGFTLKEIRGLLAAAASEPADARAPAWTAIELRILKLEALRHALRNRGQPGPPP